MTMRTLDTDTLAQVHSIIAEEINSYASSHPAFDATSLLAVEDWIATSQAGGGLIEAFKTAASDPAAGLAIAEVLCARFRDLM
jgi:hypothetical protein